MSLFIEDFNPLNEWTLSMRGGYYANGAPMHVLDQSISHVGYREWAKLNTAASDRDKEIATLWTKHFSHREYYNESIPCLWLKCTGIFLAGLIIHPLALVINIAVRLFRCLVYSLVFIGALCGLKSAQEYVERYASQAKNDFVKLLLSPFGCAGLIISSCYGMLSPLFALVTQLPSVLWTEDSISERLYDMLRDSRKLYASFERGIYGTSVIAPCFQPRKDGRPLVPHLFLGSRAHLFGGNTHIQNAI